MSKQVAFHSFIGLLSRVYFVCFACVILCIFGAGCATNVQTAGLLAGGIATGAVTPSHELEEIYYLGVFDPEQQLPSAVYRVRVHGQSSPLNSTRFASGWVPAKLVDSLGSQISIDTTSQSPANIQAAPAGQEATLEVGRRMVLFGPEGMREAPAGYRLVIVTGSDPSKFFNAIDQVLGASGPAGNTQGSPNISSQLLNELQILGSSRQKLNDLKLKEANDIPKGR